MAELGLVLKESWRRYRASPVLWQEALQLAFVGVLGILFLGALFIAAGTGGVRLLLLGVGAYMAMALAGLGGVCAAVCGGRAATSKDFSGGRKRFFWRAAGFLALVNLTSAVFGLIAGGLGVPGVGSSRLLSLNPATASAAAALGPQALVGTQVFGTVSGLVIALLFCFGGAAMVLEDVPTMRGISRGLDFVGRRFWLALGLLILGALVVQGPALILVVPVLANLPSLTGPGVAQAASAVAAWAVPFALAFAVYACFAAPFALLMIFVAYGRYRGLVQPFVPSPAAPPPATPAALSRPAPPTGTPPAGAGPSSPGAG